MGLDGKMLMTIDATVTVVKCISQGKFLQPPGQEQKSGISLNYYGKIGSQSRETMKRGKLEETFLCSLKWADFEDSNQKTKD